MMPRCPHLAPGTTAHGATDIAGELVAVCASCWVFTRRAKQQINSIAQFFGMTYDHDTEAQR